MAKKKFNERQQNTDYSDIDVFFEDHEIDASGDDEELFNEILDWANSLKVVEEKS